MEINNVVMELVNEFKSLEEVEAILLAGSYGAGTNDAGSDYDLYVYTSKELEVSRRKPILDKFFKYIEINNTFWETEDDGFLKESLIPVEIIYRDVNWIEGVLDRVVIQHQADTGYTTCFWANLMKSIILYDKNGRLKELQDKYNVSYPKELKEEIVRKNYKLLKEKMPAYYHQIKKALGRDDLISVNHRVAALLASYFDIIFAVNEFLHPGEKKLIKIIKDNNLRIPKSMESNINKILDYSVTNRENLLNQIDKLVENLNDFLNEEQINYLI